MGDKCHSQTSLNTWAIFRLIPSYHLTGICSMDQYLVRNQWVVLWMYEEDLLYYIIFYLQPICKLETLNHFKGGTSALETGWSSLGRGIWQPIPGALFCTFFLVEQQMTLGSSLRGSGPSILHLHTGAVLFWLPDIMQPVDLLRAEARLYLQTCLTPSAQGQHGRVYTRNSCQFWNGVT